MSPVAPEARLFGRRSRLVVTASTAYVGALSVYATTFEHRGRASLAAFIGVVLAASLGARDRWLALAAWGFAVAVAAYGADSSPWVVACGTIGAAAACVAAIVAIARVSAPAGLARPKARAPYVALGFEALVWGLAIGTRVAFAVGGRHGLAAEAGWIAPLACVAAFAILVLESWRTAVARRLELGVAARMDASWGLAGAAAAIGVALAFADLDRLEQPFAAAIALASLLVVAASLHGDPVRIAQVSRRAVALVIVGGPIVLLGAMVAQSNPWQAGGVAAVLGVVALAVGLAAPVLEEPLRPARGAWLDATHAAHEALLRTDPDEAIREALVALRKPAGLEAPSPELWTFDPMRVTSVDAAGYAHVAEVLLPDSLLAFATGEPEAVLRLEVLDALEVRNAELRPLARWMRDRGAMLAAVVTRAGEAEGLLVLPRGKRVEALSLEEARAVKRLADALAALCHARASLARSLDRERRAEIRAEEAETERARVADELARRAAIHTLAAERLARPATVGIYSAAARFAYDAIEDAGRADRSLFVHAPSGIDAVPFVARAHLGGPRRGEPLVVVDGTSTREHDLDRWLDRASSPLALAERGALVIVDVVALPPAVQSVIGRAHAERRAPWDDARPLQFALVATASITLDDARPRLDPVLAPRLDAALQVSLPRLRDRPEDLRAILGDRLAREGLRVRGRPVGIDDAAFSRLLDYPFEAEDAELAALVVRLVASCDGDVVRAKHMDALLADPAVWRSTG